MRLCDLTYAYNEVSGGIRTYIDAKRAYLRDHTEHEHVLIIPGEQDHFLREGRLSVYRIASPILPGSAPYRLILRVDKVLAVLRDTRPDLIELGSLYTLPWTAFHYRRQHAVPIVGFYHTDLPDVYVEPAATKLLGEWAGKQAYRLSTSYVRAIYARCSATITASPALAAKLKRIGLSDVTCIPLGVDLETFHPGHRDPILRAQLGVSEGGLLLVYAGRFDLEKRVHVLANAFKKLPAELNASLVFVGQGPLEERLREIAAASDRMHVLPFQNDKHELARLLASADVYLASNPHETFGLSVVEAQACGLPVVGVRSGALIERIPPEVGLLVEPDSAAAMADGITAIAAADRAALGQAARQHVEHRFGWTTTFDRVLRLYEQLV